MSWSVDIMGPWPDADLDWWDEHICALRDREAAMQYALGKMARIVIRRGMGTIFVRGNEMRSGLHEDGRLWARVREVPE